MKVVLADSSELIQKGMESIISDQSFVTEFSVIKDETDMTGNQKLKSADILIIDFVSSGFSIDSISLAKAEMNNANILAITNEQSAFTIVNALKAGVRSYVKKTCSTEEIIEAVESTANSEAFFCGQIVEAIQAENISVKSLSKEEFTCSPIKLSTREIQIIELIAEGHTNTQIAEKLFLSAHTVNTHRKNIMAKLGVNNTAAIVMYAVKTKLISPNKFLFNSV